MYRNIHLDKDSGSINYVEQCYGKYINTMPFLDTEGNQRDKVFDFVWIHISVKDRELYVSKSDSSKLKNLDEETKYNDMSIFQQFINLEFEQEFGIKVSGTAKERVL